MSTNFQNPYSNPQQGPAAAQSPPPYFNSGYNAEQDDFMANRGEGFSELKIRHAFIRKVYSIVSFQLLITVAFIAIFVSVKEVSTWFFTNSWMMWILIAITFVIMMVLACCESVSRSFPTNIILLFVFTLCESLLMGAISATYKTDTVLMAAGITCLVVIGITIFAFQTKIDFTGMGVFLFVAALILFAFGLLSIIFRTKIMSILYGAIGAGIFSMYLVFDTQLMLGGKLNPPPS